MPHSHHSHSGQFCRHAKDTLEGVVKEAIRQGFEVFGLSEHAPRYRLEDLFPEEADLRPTDLTLAYKAFLVEAARLRAKYSDRISLLIGIETDYITDLDIAQTTSLLSERSDIDYIVGSVHHVNGVSIDFDRPTWVRALRTAASGSTSTTMRIEGSRPILPDVEDSDVRPAIGDIRLFLLAYLDAQYEMMQRLQPEVIGHFDLCLLWTPDIPLTSLELSGVWEKVERNVRYAVEYGALFEANAAAIRKGWETSYPNPEILQLILELGGRICLSDDSHGVSYVGLNYLRMREYLETQGVREVWYLLPAKRREEGDVTIGTRQRVVARRMKDWYDHPFWRRLESLGRRT